MQGCPSPGRRCKRRNYMGNIIIPKNYTSFVKANEVYDLCRPITNNTGIDCVGYCRVYKDGSIFSLTTHNKFLHFIYQTGISADFELLDTIATSSLFTKGNSNKKCWFLTEVFCGDYWQQISNSFKLSNYLSIAEKFPDYYELFEFATCSGKNISSFYLNHYEILETFMLYFKDRGDSLIKEAAKNKICTPKHNLEYKKVTKNLKQMVMGEKVFSNNFTAELQLKKYPLHNKDVIAHITSRELECLRYISQGYSYKEAGRILQISPRTLEVHLRNIKDKLNIDSQKDLWKIYRSSMLANL